MGGDDRTEFLRHNFLKHESTFWSGDLLILSDE